MKRSPKEDAAKQKQQFQTENIFSTDKNIQYKSSPLDLCLNTWTLLYLQTWMLKKTLAFWLNTNEVWSGFVNSAFHANFRPLFC